MIICPLGGLLFASNNPGFCCCLSWRLENCASGELIFKWYRMGYRMDIAVCAELDADDCAPVLRDGAFVKVN